MNKSQQSGFTLIELVAVIVLLGILAVAALPRFINIQGDARESTIDGIAASMRTAVSQSYAKALVDNATGATDTIADGNGNTIALVYGYPAVYDAANDTIDDLTGVAGGELVGWTTTSDLSAVVAPAAATDLVVYNGYSDTCKVAYTQATSSAQPTITTTTSDCD